MSERVMSGLSSGVLLVLLLCCGCGEAVMDEEPFDDGRQGLWWMEREVQEALPIHASGVVRFSPGEGAGFGKAEMPEVVLGAPYGGSDRQGSLDVVSLGVGGELVLDFGEGVLLDGPGVDLLVFENAFTYGNDMVFAELAQVAVSLDGEQWFEFACDVESWEGCAGRTPTMEDASAVLLEAWQPGLAEMVGGDGFDLSEVGLEAARYVRVRDVSMGRPVAPSAGADVDAITGLYGVRP